MRSSLLVAVCLTALAVAPAASAHGDVDVRIAELDARIAAEQADAALYIKRGEIHRVNLHWDLALEDYRAAETLTPEDPELHFYRGRMLLESGRAAAALPELNRYLALRTEHREALLARARALVKLEKYDDAAVDYEATISLREHPTPEYFLEWAAALAAIDGGLPEAVDALDEGVCRLGPLITLQRRAMDYAARMGRFDEALLRLATVRRWLRPERFEAQRAELLLAARRRTDALRSYRAALHAIEALPAGRRRIKPVAELQASVESALSALVGGD